jgi:hypothetical protein
MLGKFILPALREAAIRNKTIIALRATLLATLLVLPRLGEAATLKAEASRGFDQYVRLTEEHMQTALQPGAAFLWVDGLPEARRRDAHGELQHGSVVMERLETRVPAGPTQTPGAMIHHWIGTVFIPGTSLQQVLAVLQDYDHHSIYYSPEVTKSKTLERTGDDFKMQYRLTQTRIVTVVLDTDFDVHYKRLDGARVQSRSYSTRIVEIEHPGEPDERALPPGNDHGFLWRLNSYWRFSEADRGVYVQCEAISLTRDIPTGLNWLIGPFIESIPRASLEFTLRSTRAAVLGGGLHGSR